MSGAVCFFIRRTTRRFDRRRYKRDHRTGLRHFDIGVTARAREIRGRNPSKKPSRRRVFGQMLKPIGLLLVKSEFPSDVFPAGSIEFSWELERLALFHSCQSLLYSDLAHRTTWSDT